MKQELTINLTFYLTAADQVLMDECFAAAALDSELEQGKMVENLYNLDRCVREGFSFLCPSPRPKTS